MSTKNTESSNKREFNYGRSKIEYLLIYEERKNLAITVMPDKSVVVKAPTTSGFDVIQAKLQKRGQWVLRQINYFDKFHPLQPEREYLSGETHYYLGRQYRLRIKKNGQESVKLIGKFFQLLTKDINNVEHIRSQMNQWYADHAKLMINYRAELYAKQILGSNHEIIDTKYKFLKQRWGNYDPNGEITFNIELVKTPIQCIDYVIVHELCHVIYSNHEKSFYNLMGTLIPDWQERKEKLELFGVK